MSSVPTQVRKLFVSLYGLESRFVQILDTVAEIQERHDAVRDIEKKLLELHQVFHLIFQLSYLSWCQSHSCIDVFIPF